MTTSKTRKLEYIRTKNILRSGGGKWKYLIKVPNDVINDEKALLILLKDTEAIALNEVEKYFKMKFKLVSVRSGHNAGDILKDLITLSFTFKRVT